MRHIIFLALVLMLLSAPAQAHGFHGGGYGGGFRGHGGGGFIPGLIIGGVIIGSQFPQCHMESYWVNNPDGSETLYQQRVCN